MIDGNCNYSTVLKSVTDKRRKRRELYEESGVAVDVPRDSAGTLVVGQRRLDEVARCRRDFAVLAMTSDRRPLVGDVVDDLGDVIVGLLALVAWVTLHHPLYTCHTVAATISNATHATYAVNARKYVTNAMNDAINGRKVRNKHSWRNGQDASIETVVALRMWR